MANHREAAEIVRIESQCVKSDTGMDLTNAISLVLADGMLCNLQSSATCVGDNTGVIAGTEGNLIIDNINNPQTITVNGPDRTYIETLRVPPQITGYEYQFLACWTSCLDNFFIILVNIACDIKIKLYICIANDTINK